MLPWNYAVEMVFTTRYALRRNTGTASMMGFFLSSRDTGAGVLVKSVHLVAGRLRFYSQSSHTKDFNNSIRSFRVRRSAQAEVRRVLCMCCSSCMSLNSVQSFVIEIVMGRQLKMA